MESSESIRLIIHVAALVVGYGTVIVVDSIGALWLFGRISRERMLRLTVWAQVLIWAALIAMLISGAALGPDLSKPLTQLKMGLIIALLINGLNIDILRKRTEQLSGQSFWDAPHSYKVWSIFSIFLSQVLWIAIITVGYVITHS